MNKHKIVLLKEGQSASNTKLRCKICIIEIQQNHYVGFLFGIIDSGLFHFSAAEESMDKVLARCEARVKEVIPDCKLDAR
ncbi:MAG: hypothetical protein WCO56_21950 [Verrucomicrobiota bacterium]